MVMQSRVSTQRRRSMTGRRRHQQMATDNLLLLVALPHRLPAQPVTKQAPQRVIWMSWMRTTPLTGGTMSRDSQAVPMKLSQSSMAAVRPRQTSPRRHNQEWVRQMLIRGLDRRPCSTLDRYRDLPLTPMHRANLQNAASQPQTHSERRLRTSALAWHLRRVRRLHIRNCRPHDRQHP